MASFSEKLHDGMAACYTVKKQRLVRKTPFQRMKVLDTVRFGRMLVLDDIVETTEADEFIYHEMMAHVPLYTHPNPKRVLIIGGGDGGVLREVLRHPVERVVMVEIDGAVVEAAKKHLRKICGEAFKNPRTELIIGDGAEYVRDTSETFDVVIVDSTDPLGPSMPLFGETFCKHAANVMSRDGLLVRQTGSAFLQGAELASAMKHARKVFPCVKVFLTSVPTCVGGHFTHPLMGLSDFSRRISLPAVRRRFNKHPLAMKYYNPDIHAAAFGLPEYIQALCREGRTRGEEHGR